MKIEGASVRLEGYINGAIFYVDKIINGRKSAAVELSIITKALKPYKTNKQQLYFYFFENLKILFY